MPKAEQHRRHRRDIDIVAKAVVRYAFHAADRTQTKLEKSLLVDTREQKNPAAAVAHVDRAEVVVIRHDDVCRAVIHVPISAAQTDAGGARLRPH